MEGEEASSYEEQMAQRKRAWKHQQEGDDGAEEIIDGDDADAAGADASHDDEASGASVPAEVAALKERGNAAYKAREYEEAVKVRAAAAPPPSDPCRLPDAAGRRSATRRPCRRSAARGARTRGRCSSRCG